MNVFIEPQHGLSRAMDRVTRAFKEYAPAGVVFVKDVNEADLEVLHAIGYPETVERARAAIDAGREFALIQYCVRSTDHPSAQDWLPVWYVAKMVFSYYDLYRLCDEDHVAVRFSNFVCAPLGIDRAFVQSPPNGQARRGILTSGYVSAGSEAIEECWAAASRIGERVVHLGPYPVKMGVMSPDADVSVTGPGITDALLRVHYDSVKFVSGLRYVEGFEMPCVEGLARGVRPIVFDRPDMRKWYDGFAIFVKEQSGPRLVQELVDVMHDGTHVTEEERQAALTRFSWERTARSFWGGLSA
jgi:hypothetical protein